jgi:hypothetical protein
MPKVGEICLLFKARFQVEQLQLLLEWLGNRSQCRPGNMPAARRAVPS